MEEKFADILENDEIIIKTLKPVKSRYWKQFLVPFGIPIFWPHLILILAGTLFTVPFFVAKAYRNTYYAYTNKRLIVRNGVFGANFTSLDYKDITSTSVNVGVFDKKHNTGSLTFSSPSVHAGKAMRFDYIENPYDEMRNIKEYIDRAKK